MDKELKELLAMLEEKQNNRKQEIDALSTSINQIDTQKKDSIKRFKQAMENDIASGVYMNTTEGKLQKMIDEETAKIEENANKEKQELSKRLEEAKNKDEESKVSEYSKISSAINDHHFKIGMEIIKAERELKETQAEKNEKIASIDKQISEKQARYTHLIVMKSRNYMDMNMSQDSAEIAMLKSELDELNAQKEDISKEFNTKILEHEQYIKDCNVKKERAAKFIGQIRVSTKSIKEIFEILFEEQVLDKEDEKNKPQEEKVEEKTDIIETEATERQEEAEVTETVEGSNNELEEMVGNIEPYMDENWVRKPNVQSKKFISQENIRKKALDRLQEITGMSYVERVQIGQNKEYLDKFIELYQGKDMATDEIENAMIDYYMGIDQKFSISVDSQAIYIDGYSNSDMEASSISIYEDKDEKNKEYIDALVSEYIGDDDIMYDKNIIIAIATGGSYKLNEDGTRQLTASAEKKLKAYVNMLKNPSSENKEKCSIEYDLRKMSWTNRFLSKNSWSKEDMKNIEEIAYEAKDIYADVKVGPIMKAKWAIKDMLKKATIKTIESKEKELVEEIDSAKNFRQNQRDEKAIEETKQLYDENGNIDLQETADSKEIVNNDNEIVQ